VKKDPLGAVTRLSADLVMSGREPGDREGKVAQGSVPSFYRGLPEELGQSCMRALGMGDPRHR